MNSIIILINAIPEILILIKAVAKDNNKKKAKEDLKKIAKAIEDGDEKALNDVFNSL